MFSARLKKLRTEKGLSQEDLAKIIGVKQQTVGGWETGRTEPDHQLTLKIADFFDVTTDYLLGRTNYKNVAITISTSRTVYREDDLPEQAIKEIENFKEFIRAKYSKK